MSKLMGIWFQRKSGRVIGITAMGNNFGGFVMPPLLGFILSVLMWQGTYAVLAFMSGALVL